MKTVRWIEDVFGRNLRLKVKKYESSAECLVTAYFLLFLTSFVIAVSPGLEYICSSPVPSTLRRITVLSMKTPSPLIMT
jgi:hypothetical protein